MYGQFNKSTRHLRVALAVVATVGTLVIPTVGHAMDWYGGLSFGKVSHETTVGDLLGKGFSTGTVDGSGSGWKALAGMVLWDKYVGAEFGYVSLGKATAVSGSTASATSEVKGFTVGIAGLIPFSSQFGLVLKLGAIRSTTDLATSGTGVPASSSAADTNPFGGLGFQFDFSKSMGVRVEMERYNTGSLGSPYVGLTSAGLIYRF